MQLQSLAKSTEVLNKVTSILNNTKLSSITVKKELETIGKSYTTETLKAAIAQSTLKKEQIEAILTANGLQGELLETTVDELANAASTNAVAASQKIATASTFEFGTAIKGLGIQISKLVTAHPILTAVALAGITLFGITKAIKRFTVSLKDQQEITQNLQNELSELQSDISDINSELQTTDGRIHELNAKDNLSFVEQEELENLIAQNDELERTNRLLAEQEDKKRQQVAESVRQEFNKEYENQRYVRILSEQQVNEMAQKRARWEELRLNSGYHTEEEIAEMQQLRQELDEWDSVETPFVNFPTYLQSVIAAYEDLSQRKKENGALSEYEENLLTAYRNKLINYAIDLDDYIGRYGIDDETSQSWKDLSAAIYECLYPAEYLTQKFNDVFDSLSENVRSELKQLAENGSLSVDNLSDDIISRFSEAGFSAAEVIEQLRSMFDDFGNSAIKEPIAPPTVTETVEQISTRLKTAFDALRSAYQSIFTLDEDTGEQRFTPLSEADYTDQLYPILSALQILDEISGIDVDYTQFDTFTSVLADTSSTAKQIQEQFDRLATDIIYTSDCTNMSAETFNLLAKSLSEIGITNAYETLERIRDAQEELAALSYDAETAVIEEGKSITELGLASVETEEYLRHYLLQKNLAQNPLSTLDDVTELAKLCNALGVTGEMLEAVNILKAALHAKENGNVFGSGVDEAIKRARQKIEELTNGDFPFGFHFSSPSKNAPPGSSARPTANPIAETYDWTTTAIGRVEKEIEALDKIADSAYSTFSQKNEALAQEIGKVSEEIALQQQAYSDYMNRAEAVGLSDHYKNLVQNGSPGIEDITDESLQEQISEYRKWYEKAQDTQSRIRDLYGQSHDLHVASYENCVAKLETLRDSQTISEREYLDRMTSLWEHYYEGQTKFAVHAKETKLKLLGAEKDYLESIANTAANLLGGRIDELKSQQKSEISLLEAKKKPLEEQLELLEEQKDKEDRILALQHAQYELKRAENQRDHLTYIDGQMVYRADQTDIRSAKDSVADAAFQIRKGTIQDQIDAYDKEIEKINERYEAEISGIARIEQEWQTVLSLRERTLHTVDFESLFGEGSVAKLLNGDLSMISTWKQTYLDTLSAIDTVSIGSIGDLTSEYALLNGLDLSGATEQAKIVSSHFDTLNDSVDRLNTAIGAAPSDKTSKTADSADQIQDGTDAPSLVCAIQSTYDTASETLPQEVRMMNALTEAANIATAAIHELQSAIESLNVLSAHTTGAPMSGNAYASGTKHAKRGLAIVGEEKPEVIITNDQKALLAKQPTLLSMEGGETVLDGDETARLLKRRGLRSIAAEESPLLQALSHYSPAEIRQRFAPRMTGPAPAISSASSNASHSVTNNAVHNPSYTMGDVHIHCPGITKDEVAKQIGAELTNVFTGMSLNAYQRVNITR